MCKKILVIDDDKEILFAMSAICEYQNWIPITAVNVMEGLKLVKKEKPDVILIDYYMPVINGMEGVKEIRKLDNEVPIIVLTVEENQKVANEFLEAGASDFALKPIKAPDIISRIKVHLKLKGAMTVVNMAFDDYTKGISQETLGIIEKYMKSSEAYYSISDIADGTGLAYQTVHRYLQYMESKNKVEVNHQYGKIGRPQKRYRLKSLRNDESLA